MGILVLISITAVLAMIDITVKSCIEGNLLRKEERTAFGGRLILRKVYNQGFAMELMDDEPEKVRYVSVFSAMVLTIVQLASLLFRGRPARKIGLSLMTAGAWSNTFDRWIRGYVIDYFGIQTKWKKITKITWNLADVFLMAGGILVALSYLFGRKRKR